MKKLTLICGVLLFCKVGLLFAQPIVLGQGAKESVLDLQDLQLNDLKLTNIDVGDTLMMETDDPVCVFKGNRVLFSVDSNMAFVPSDYGYLTLDTLLLWSEGSFKVSSPVLPQKGWIERVLTKDYFVNILFVLLLSFIAYMRFYQPQSLGYFYNPFALFNNKLYEDTFNFQPFLFPNLIFLALNGAIIGASVGDVLYSEMFQTKLLFAFVGALFLPLKSTLSYLVLSYLSAQSVNRTIHINFVRVINFFTLILLTLRIDQLDMLGFGTSGLLVLTFVFVLLWLLRASLDILNTGVFQKFYFFSYLCALEILPVIFVCLAVSRI